MGSGLNIRDYLRSQNELLANQLELWSNKPDDFKSQDHK